MHREYYQSPVGRILLTFDRDSLTSLGFAASSGQYAPEKSENQSRISVDTRRWLDIYFDGGVPDFTPRLKPVGTPFRQKVWQLLREIPYGESITYGEIAERIARESGMAKMSAQAVGGAVGANPISIIVPCHRVLGKGGALTGYEWGLDVKKALLDIEGISYK